MPYKLVEITPEQKFRWNWRIKDSINFILFKWEFLHTFTSVQEEYADFLTISFENSNQVNNFNGKILFRETNEDPYENTVTLQFDTIGLKDPLLNSVKPIFIELIQQDYRKFLNNVYEILANKELRLQILEECYWTDYNAVVFPKDK